MIEVLKQALEALEYYGWHKDDCGRFGCDCGYDNAIASLHQAIAELASQEPDWRDGVMEQQTETILWQAKRIAELIDTPTAQPAPVHWKNGSPPIGTKLYTHPPQRTEQEPVALREALAEALGCVYVCDKTWSAWGVGTMTQNDFYFAAESEEVLDSLVEAVAKAAPPSQPAQRTEQRGNT